MDLTGKSKLQNKVIEKLLCNSLSRLIFGCISLCESSEVIHHHKNVFETLLAGLQGKEVY